MSDPQRDLAYLADMLSRARVAVAAAEGFARADLTPLSPQSAMLERWVEVIGEAARKVSDDYKSAHPEIPWRKIIATRHIIAHDYGAIRHDVIWKIVKEYLPELIAQLQPLIPPPPPDPQPEPT